MSTVAFSPANRATTPFKYECDSQRSCLRDLDHLSHQLMSNSSDSDLQVNYELGQLCYSTGEISQLIFSSNGHLTTIDKNSTIIQDIDSFDYITFDFVRSNDIMEYIP